MTAAQIKLRGCWVLRGKGGRPAIAAGGLAQRSSFVDWSWVGTSSDIRRHFGLCTTLDSSVCGVWKNNCLGGCSEPVRAFLPATGHGLSASIMADCLQERQLVEERQDRGDEVISGKAH
jgi:hypothetical protein